MKMQSATTEGRNQFTATGNGFVAVNGHIQHHSLVVTPERIVPQWPVRDVAELTAELIEALPGVRDAIVLLGTGQRQVFPPPALLRQCALRGIALELMDSAAACRTFNLLVGEGRQVVAAVILPGEGETG